MNVKTLLSGMSVVAVLVLGTAVDAEPVKKAPVPQKAQPPASEETLHLKPGQTHTLPLKGVTRVAVADPDVADIRVTPQGLRINALKKGQTALLVWKGADERHAYTVSVKD